MDEPSRVLATRLSRRLMEAGCTVAVAESCTGGMLASTLTDISGASRWFSHGWVTYSYRAKAVELGIDTELLDRYGAVSTQVAEAMAEGARLASGADLAISVTGIAGPRADDSDKDIGLVHVGVSTADGRRVKQAQFGGNRSENKDAFVTFALRTAIDQWDKLRDRDARIEAAEEVARREQDLERMEKVRRKALEKARAAAVSPWSDDVWNQERKPISVGPDVEWTPGMKPREEE